MNSLYAHAHTGTDLPIQHCPRPCRSFAPSLLYHPPHRIPLVHKPKVAPAENAKSEHRANHHEFALRRHQNDVRKCSHFDFTQELDVRFAPSADTRCDERTGCADRADTSGLSRRQSQQYHAQRPSLEPMIPKAALFAHRFQRNTTDVEP